MCELMHIWRMYFTVNVVMSGTATHSERYAERRWLRLNCSDFRISMAIESIILTVIAWCDSFECENIYVLIRGRIPHFWARCLIRWKCDCQQEILANHSINRIRNDQMELHLRPERIVSFALASIISKNWSVNIECVKMANGDFAQSQSGRKYD